MGQLVSWWCYRLPYPHENSSTLLHNAGEAGFVFHMLVVIMCVHLNLPVLFVAMKRVWGGGADPGKEGKQPEKGKREWLNRENNHLEEVEGIRSLKRKGPLENILDCSVWRSGKKDLCFKYRKFKLYFHLIATYCLESYPPHTHIHRCWKIGKCYLANWSQVSLIWLVPLQNKT